MPVRNGRLIAEADITPWKDEGDKNNLHPKNDQDIFDMIDEGIGTAKIARAVIVSRETKQAPKDILPGNEWLLMAAGQNEISKKIKSKCQTAFTASGIKFDVPVYMGNIDKKGNDNNAKHEEHSYAKSVSDEGFSRALDYITRIIPGHIFSHFGILFANGEDLESAAITLKNKIDQMVDYFTQENKEISEQSIDISHTLSETQATDAS